MPIHFSVGFVTEQSPKRAFISTCAVWSGPVIAPAVMVDNVQFQARLVTMQEITAIWPREDKKCR